MRRSLFFMLSLTIVSACMPGNKGILDTLPQRSFSAHNIQTIIVEIDSGKMDVRQSADEMIQFSGMAPVSQPVIPIHTENNNAISIQILPGSSAESVYVLEVPAGKELKIRSNKADINLDNINGDMTAVSISGEITGNKLNGSVTLRSGRGNVTLQDSVGELTVLGEHGILTMKNLHGLVTSSTIMGTIRFNGQPADADAINLEVDHGPIIVSLSNDSDLKYAVNSASGEITCLLPGATFVNRGCSGIMGNGSAHLKIRSVSGKIKLSTVY